MNEPTLTAMLVPVLREWLPRQRWFPVKTADFALEQAGSLRLEDVSGQARLEVFLLAVSYRTADGGNRTDVVQVPLSYRDFPLAGAERGLVGRRPDAGMPWIYDAVYDPSFVAAWLELIRSEGSRPGSATGHSTRSDHRLPTANGVVKVLSGEQSNSSVIVDDGESAAIVKFFRVLSEGVNPEVEVGAALTTVGTSEVPATLGWVRGEWTAPFSQPPGQLPSDSRQVQGELAVAHEFLAGGRDAWRLAVDAARSGTDFTAEAHGLGAATA
ncbi:maltokinase N-terminal cap-like domain-containing protein, partial [Arthrobacter sp. HMWF013]|uniref:maltokinase N-terminal cap-like domain-containing protein n=1 Tax=Arthrobacter sp. HMWF013 TaxID=2056849 RepID=UPI000D4952F6